MQSQRSAADTDIRQLDAGMHPAYEGLSAMPFYDEFDLSTVDVLLISQYVYACSPLSFSILVEGTWRITAVGLCMRGQRPAQHHLVYQNQWNIICILPTDFGDVPPSHPSLVAYHCSLST
jgi:hypothetical protein